MTIHAATMLEVMLGWNSITSDDVGVAPPGARSQTTLGGTASRFWRIVDFGSGNPDGAATMMAIASMTRSAMANSPRTRRELRRGRGSSFVSGAPSTAAGDVSLVTLTPLVSVASAAGGQVPGQSSKLAKNRRMSRHTTIQPLPRPRSDPARTKMGSVPSC